MKNLFKNLAIVVVIVAAGYYFRAPLMVVWSRLATEFLPCRQPIYYSIGQFDKEFGISQATFLADVARAADMWEKPIGKNLFEYSERGDLKINLIYDYRQQATTKLQKIGASLDATRASYDALKAQYGSMQAQYAQADAQYEAALAEFERDQEEYNRQVQAANRRGGASEKEYGRLNAQRDELEDRAADLNRLRDSLNEKVNALNSMAADLNAMAASLNLDVAKFNAIGEERGEEFDEGVYKSGPTGRQIDIYQFDSQSKLVRVLAHELGHAVGLDHVDDSKAIMYRLNQGTAEKLTATDLAALKAKCGME